MRRVREAWSEPQPESLLAPSGCVELRGEDLRCEARRRALAQRQGEMLREQLAEQAARRSRSREEKRAEDELQLLVTRTRGLAEQQERERRQRALADVTAENARMAAERRARAEADRQAHLEAERTRLQEVHMRGRPRSFELGALHQ